LFYSLGNKGSSSDNSYKGDSENSNWGTIFVVILIAILLFINGLTYFFGINLFAYITGLFSGKPVVNIVVDEKNPAALAPVPEIPIIEEVFNIPGNYYSYDDSKAICTAYGAKLASYEQIENAYNKGAEWCNYGWTEGQLALFPTQKNTWLEYQKSPTNKHACGRPGINGGYIEDKNTKYGVNCYGKKPAASSEDLDRMKSCMFQESPEEKDMNDKVNEWSKKLDCLTLNSYNKFKWSGVSSS
jgi:hypothetical protein